LFGAGRLAGALLQGALDNGVERLEAVAFDFREVFVGIAEDIAIGIARVIRSRGRLGLANRLSRRASLTGHSRLGSILERRRLGRQLGGLIRLIFREAARDAHWRLPGLLRLLK
jgi:hypothetical protein